MPFRHVLTYLAYNASKNKMIKAIRDEQERNQKYR